MQVFDFTARRFMSPGSAGAVVTHVDGVVRASPLLLLPIGDALQATLQLVAAAVLLPPSSSEVDCHADAIRIPLDFTAAVSSMPR